MKTAMQLAIEHYEDLSLNGSNQAYVVAKFLKDNFLEIEKQQHGETWDASIENYKSRGENEVRAWADFDDHYNEKYS